MGIEHTDEWLEKDFNDPENFAGNCSLLKLRKVEDCIIICFASVCIAPAK